jgi:HK97 gp10 family phage protein
LSEVLTGVDNLLRAADRAAKAVADQTRGVASKSAMRIANGIRSRVRVDKGNLRSRVAVAVDPAKRQFLVGFPNITESDRAGWIPMLPVWHEFGTRKMTANPAVQTASNAERGRYEAEMRQAIASALKEFAS